MNKRSTGVAPRFIMIFAFQVEQNIEFLLPLGSLATIIKVYSYDSEIGDLFARFCICGENSIHENALFFFKTRRAHEG